MVVVPCVVRMLHVVDVEAAIFTSRRTLVISMGVGYSF